MKFAIVHTEYNPEITLGLLKGAQETFALEGFPVAPSDTIRAPGAFELPLLAKALAKTGRYNGVVCIGCVIKGDTAHFEFISLGAAMGIQQASLETEVPIAFGILTTYTEEQALLRSRENSENKGIEAARACIESAKALQRIKN